MRETYSGSTEMSSAKAASICKMRFETAVIQGVLRYPPASTAPSRRPNNDVN